MCAEFSSRWRSKAKFPRQLPEKKGVFKTLPGLLWKCFVSSTAGDTIAHTPTSFLKRDTNKAHVSEKSPSLRDRPVFCTTASLPAERLAWIIQHSLPGTLHLRKCIFPSPLSLGVGRCRVVCCCWANFTTCRTRQAHYNHILTSFKPTFNPKIISNTENKLIDSELCLAEIPHV